MSSRRALAPKRQDLGDARMAPGAHDPDRGAVRGIFDQLDAIKRGDLLATRGVILLDVPGVPVAQLVRG